MEKGLPRLQGAEEGEQETCGKHLILLLVSWTFTPSPDGLSGGGGISGMTGSGFKETTLSNSYLLLEQQSVSPSCYLSPPHAHLLEPGTSRDSSEKES